MRAAFGSIEPRRARSDAPYLIRPFIIIPLKNLRVRQPEAIDALLHVADEKTVRRLAVTAQRCENRVLCRVDVLILIHEDVRQPRPPFGRDRRVAEQSQRALLQIREIHATQLALLGGERRRELARQTNQRAHLRPRPLPILPERIVVVIRCQAAQKLRVIKKCCERIPELFFRAAGPMLVLIRRRQRLQCLGALRERWLDGQCFQRGQRQPQCLRLVRHRRHFGFPSLAPGDDGLHKQLAPFVRLVGFKPRLLLVQPAHRVRQRLRVGMHFQNQFADALVHPAPAGANQRLHGERFRVRAGVMSFQQLIQGLALERTRLLFIQHAELRVEAKVVEVFARELQAKAVQRADARGIEQGQLLGEMLIIRLGRVERLQFLPQPSAHLRRSRLGERHHQNVFEGRPLRDEQPEAARDERVGLARARARDHEQIAAPVDRRRLLLRKLAHGVRADAGKKRVINGQR